MKNNCLLVLFVGLFVVACNDKIETSKISLKEEAERILAEIAAGEKLDELSELVSVPTTCKNDECYRVVVIYGCEYLELRQAHAYAFTHKGDCKNPIHQHQK